MAKTISINPSWYWPDDVPRLTGVPPLRCDRLMAQRWATRHPDALALADAGETLTYGELWQRVEALAAGLRERLPPRERVALWSPAGIDGAVALLGCLAADARPLLLAPDADPQGEAAAGAALAITAGPGGAPAAAAGSLDAAELAAAAPRAPAPTAPGEPASTPDVHEPALTLVSPQGWLVGHSHYSLVGGALSLATFLAEEEPAAWLCATPLWSWEGLYSLIVPLYRGGAAVLCDDQGLADALAGAVDDHAVRYALVPFEELRDLARGRPRRLAAALGRNLEALLVSVAEPFGTGDRRKARKALGVPVLTAFGMTETGPILASHPSWYVDESVGIPVTNIEVQPANPQTGEPLDTLWELLDFATMVIRGPQMMAGYEGAAAGEERLAGRVEAGWFKTWSAASFDANGMMYLVEA